MIRLIVADDHDVYRIGLRNLLSRDGEIEIVGEACDGKELIALAKQLRPDVILTDLKMPQATGIEAIRELYTSWISKRNIVLSTFDSDYLVIDALEAGAIGYVLKNAQDGEIVEAIKTVFKYNPYYCSSTSLQLKKLIAESKYNPYLNKKVEVFDETEKAIIRLICEGKTSEEIGKILLMGKRNVEAKRAKILNKIETDNVVGLIMYALKNGICKIK